MQKGSFIKWQNLDIDDMPNEDLKLVAELCGVDVARSLIENLEGVTIYIPKYSYRHLIKQYIHKHFDGTNAKKLALELKISERMVYKLLKESKK